jgi:hypothetical protein
MRNFKLELITQNFGLERRISVSTFGKSTWESEKSVLFEVVETALSGVIGLRRVPF